MVKTPYDVLIRMLVGDPLPTQPMWVLSDDPFLAELSLKKLALLGRETVQVKESKGNLFVPALHQALDRIATGSFFAPPPALLVQLPDALPGALLKKIQEALQRLPAKTRSPILGFGATKLRHVLQGCPEFSPTHIVYPPTGAVVHRAIAALSPLTPQLPTWSSSQTESLANAYDGHFPSILAHLVRMELGGLSFTEALGMGGETSPHQLLDLLLRDQEQEFLQRWNKTADRASVALPLFFTSVHFFKKFLQACSLHKPFERDLFSALEIPYPMQNRFLLAKKNLSAEAVLQFMQRAGVLEYEIKMAQGKNPLWLGYELLGVRKQRGSPI